VSLKRSHGVKLPIRIANLAYWVTGTEGSNPSLSASQSQVCGILRGSAQTARV
jgi:hypothetical protein